MHEGERQVEPALHPPGVALYLAVGCLGKADTLGAARSCTVGAFGTGEVVQRRLEPEVLAAGQEGIEGGLLEGGADRLAHLRAFTDDVEAGHGRAAARGRQQGREDVHGRRFARSVGPQKAVDLAGSDLEVDAVDRPDVALEDSDQALHLDAVVLAWHAEMQRTRCAEPRARWGHSPVSPDPFPLVRSADRRLRRRPAFHSSRYPGRSCCGQRALACSSRSSRPRRPPPRGPRCSLPGSATRSGSSSPGTARSSSTCSLRRSRGASTAWNRSCPTASWPAERRSPRCSAGSRPSPRRRGSTATSPPRRESRTARTSRTASTRARRTRTAPRSASTRWAICSCSASGCSRPGRARTSGAHWSGSTARPGPTASPSSLRRGAAQPRSRPGRSSRSSFPSRR